jgi:UDP-N-acetylmuramate dehydrogenase
MRLEKYKPNLKCPGSFFKNILVEDLTKKILKNIDESKIVEGKIPAGYLLELVGAKGMRSGGVEIASFHGNLFINKGGGTAKDVMRLARLLKTRVKKKFDINLEEEIRYFA